MHDAPQSALVHQCPVLTIGAGKGICSSLWRVVDHGQTVLIVADDGAVYEWDTTVEHAVAFVCSIVGRSLSRSEWQTTVPNQPYRQTCPDS